MIDALSADDVGVITAAALAKADEIGCSTITLAVVDAGAHPMSIIRMDDRWFEVDLALAKAFSAVALGMDTNDSGPLLDSNPFWRTVPSLVAGRGSFGLGGLVIRRTEHGPVLGSIGVIGGSGEQDVAVARAGVDALTDPAVARGSRA